MRFGLQDLLERPDYTAAITAKIFGESVDRIKKKKLIERLSDESLENIRKSLSWCLGYRLNLPLHYCKEQNLLSAIEAEQLRRHVQ